MAWALFLVVAGIWAVFLLPPLWADRRPSSTFATRRQAVAETGGRTGLGPNPYQSPSHEGEEGAAEPDRATMLARRRRALTILTGVALTSLVALLVFGGTWFVVAHGVADALLVWYVMMLRRTARARRALDPFAAELEDEMMQMSRVRVVR